jgi:hypothetical protein
VYSKSEAEVNMAAEEILEIVRGKRQEATAAEVTMGFDTEWKASFQRGEGAGKVAVVQLCLEASRCDVMHIKHSGIPPSLLSILQDSTILKVGSSQDFLFSSKENFTFNTIPTKSNQSMCNVQPVNVANP